MGNNDMPWIGENMQFPRIGDDGFDEFHFTPEQVETIHDETRKETERNTASDIIRALAKLDMDSELDFLKAVQTVAAHAI